jgi:hypothetical protein
MRFEGQYNIRQYRNRKLINRFSQKNGIVDEGLDAILDIMFRGFTSPAAWYTGLIDNDSYSGLSDDDIMLDHAGWIELTAYDEAARPAWSPSHIGNNTIINSSSCVFTISATKTLKGIFLCDDATKGGTSGTLWSTAIISPTISLVDDDVIQIQYQLRAYS